jgi:hypothetical protein
MLKFGKEEQRSKKALTRYATLVLSKTAVSSIHVSLTALGIAAIQTSLATIQQHQRLGVALAAHRGAGREGAGGFIG